jgi:hypothetical protein
MTKEIKEILKEIDQDIKRKLPVSEQRGHAQRIARWNGAI